MGSFLTDTIDLQVYIKYGAIHTLRFRVTGLPFLAHSHTHTYNRIQEKKTRSTLPSINYFK